jgi:hypothetical protein
MSSTARTTAALLLAAGLGLGCGLRAYAPVPRPTIGEWPDARGQATRAAQLYDGFSHRANATATHLTLAVREARARRLGEWLGWTPPELEQRLAEERAEAAAGEDFLVAFYTADPKANDLDARQSIWRIALQLDHEDVLASNVTTLAADATLRQLFPSVGPFEVVYRIRFPHRADGDLGARPFVLLIASALGQLSIDFSAPAVPIRVIEPSPPSPY